MKVLGADQNQLGVHARHSPADLLVASPLLELHDNASWGPESGELVVGISGVESVPPADPAVVIDRKASADAPALAHIPRKQDESC
jgi:hypothetical protein